MASKKKYRDILEDFIQIYQEETCLWRIKSKDYHNKGKREAAYKKLILKLQEIEENADRDMVVKKINSLRTNIRKEKKKVQESQRSGSGSEEVYTPSLWYYHMFDFLESQDTPRSSTSNLSETEEAIRDYEEDQQSQYDIQSPKENPELNTEHSVEESAVIQQDAPQNKKLLARPNKRKGTNMCDSVLQSIDEHFKKPKVKEDRYDIVGKNVSMKLRDITNKTQIVLAEKLISDVLFLAEMNQLTMSHTVSSYSFPVNRYPNTNLEPQFPMQNFGPPTSTVPTPINSPSGTISDNEDVDNQSLISLTSYVTNFAA